jgi:replicative DNA helicase Mcm
MFGLRSLPNKEKDEQIALHVLRTHQEDVHETLLDKNIFRKYVAHAKQKIKPKISDEASTEIRRFYVDLRNRPMAAEKATIPISARQLTALIRLAEASAKLKLSNVVTVDDARIAIDLIKYYMMQVGYDEKEGVFDVDRISSRFSSSQRNKIFLVRETITALESRMGKQIPLEELEKELEDKMTKAELDEAITKLQISGDIFTPKRGIIQKTDYN